MSRLMNDVEYLAKEIGPRPAGTEEEQQAALYITEQFQKEVGFSAAIEDFSSASNTDAGLAALAAVEVVATILAMIFPILCIPAFVLAAAAAAVYALEAFDRPVLSRVLSRDASQNVVAKYQPAGDASAHGGRNRSRKIVLIAHYDTGRITPPIVSRIEAMGLPLALVCVIAMITAAFFLLLRIFVAGAGGMSLLVLNVLSVLAIIVCLLPIVKALLLRSAPYNEGACNNATGTAALVEVARRISHGSVSEAELAVEYGNDVVIHGESAAREADLVPEGAQIRYEAEQLEPPSEIGDYDAAESLLSAKAAIAALTGKPVESRVFGSVAENLVNSYAEGEYDPEADMVGAVAPHAGGQGAQAAGVSVTGAPAHDFSSVPGVSSTADEPASDAQAEGFENAPSWFVAAQQNARKAERYNADDATQVKRSRYTEAIENAERGFVDREEEQRAAELARREEEARAAIESHSAATADPKPADGHDSEPADEPAKAPTARHVEVDLEPLPQSPYGTIAMAAPFSASEIRAEAAIAGDLDAADAAAAEEAAAGHDAPRDPLASIPTIGQDEPAQAERVAELPSIDPAHPYSAPQTNNPSRSGILRKLRTNIPSLSGLIAPVGADQQSSSSAADEASGVGEIPSLEPAPAVAHAPATVEVPRSRSGNLLNRFRKNEEEEDLVGTPQEWLHVDDDFEARSVGRARGGWESFREDKYDEWSDDGWGDSDDGWQGGAFSRVQLGYVDMQSGEEPDFTDDPASEMTDKPSLTSEIEQIYHFRNPQFNTEIWFVAMGADGVGHDGARAFLNQHRDDLRGAIIVEIESLGAGTLAVASEEGRVRKVSASSRIKRFTRGATAATGIPVDSVSLAGTDSIASTMQKAGHQAMHLFGAEDGHPALKGSPDDVLENVNEQILEEHVSFIYELLKG